MSRYNKFHTTDKEVEFYLSEYTPNIQECKYLLWKVLEQAIRDYVALSHVPNPVWIETWKEAKSFLFDDEFYMDWGGIQLNLIMVTALLDLDIDWLRSKIRKKFNEKATRKRQQG